MTLKCSDYIKKSPISYFSKHSKRDVEIDPSEVVNVIIDSNNYLFELNNLFKELNFDIYNTLGQRNLSGFVGEVFCQIFSKRINGFESNPHADGRPDLLDLTSSKAKTHFYENCGERLPNGDLIPDRSSLAPFLFGGLEVKSTIGNPVNNYKKRIKDELNIEGFSVGVPRIDYVSSLTYWGHHTSCENLVGLYYDYSDDLFGTPQIMSVMHSVLDPELDWNVVSKGKAGSKKTSNTSLTVSGRNKIMAGTVAITKLTRYVEKLKSCGVGV